jgi:diguanylate cyclase (GGDEF)-like protein/PAS domain S-box-containing protein
VERRIPASRRGLSLTAVLTAVIGLSLSVAVVALYPPVEVEGSGWAALTIAAILVVLHTRPERRVRETGHIEVVHLDEILFVPLLVLLVPWQSLLVTAVGSLAGSIAVRRDWLKTTFNCGQMLIACIAGIVVVYALGYTPDPHPNVGHTLAGMAGALVMTAVSAINVAGVMAYATGASFRDLLRDASRQIIPWLGAVTLGAVATIAIGAYWLSAILVIGVVMFVHRAYASTVRELAARRHAERVRHAVVGLRTRTDPALVREELVTAARELLGAGRAAIVPDEALDDPRTLGAPLGQGERLVVAERRGMEHWDSRDRETLATLAGVAGDVLRSAEVIAQLRTITNSQSEGVIALDMTARITFANPAALQLLGAKEQSDVLGQPIQERLILRHRRRQVDFASMVARQVVAQDADATLGPPDGDTLDIAYSVTPLRAEGAELGAVIVLRDVTERRAFQDELTRRALHDELTGLPNRRLLLDRLDHAIARAATTGSQHGLLYLDLDRFKLVNDSYGHVVGDRLLIQLANRLLSCLSVADSVARMSGDEFVILVEDAEEITNVTAIAERLLHALREPFDVDGHHIFMSASIGVGMTRESLSRDDLLATVDAAAYAAKANGRNCYCLTSDESVESTRAKLDMEVRLRKGLDEDQLELHFQPIVTTGDGEVVGVESLVRWKSPHGGYLPPGQFVPLAEETGLIVPMGRWVLEQACRSVRQWTMDKPERGPLTVSVNLSALQFTQHRLPEDVAEILAVTGLPASQLVLEITETVLMSDTTATQATLDALHDLGIRVAIDDFGTGYSALSYLKKFRLDLVKLDRSFIEELVTDPVDAEIASAVIRLSSALGIRTVAEGVESQAQRDLLLRMGCPYIQGYLTARPMPAHDFLAFWDSHRLSSTIEVPELDTSQTIWS